MDDQLVLTIDLGTAATKATLWGAQGVRAAAEAPFATQHPRPGWAEQDAEAWWSSTVEACIQLPQDERDAVSAIGFSSQRESFVLATADGAPVGPAIAWSDRRAVEEASAFDDSFHVLTGVIADAGIVAAKLAWLRAHELERLADAAMILSPRDLAVMHLTGRAITDPTMSSHTGLLALDGAGLEGSELLPERIQPTAIVGEALAGAAEALGIRTGTPVVAGASDRACEVLGVNANETRPIISLGSTTSVSSPRGHVPPPAAGIVVTRGALGGYLMEAGLSPAGSALTWLADLTGRPIEDLASEAGGVEAGAGGLTALPWLGGARAPWWEPRAGLTFVGLSRNDGPAALARAVVEGSAFDAIRCLDGMAPDATELAIAGDGAGVSLWSRVLAGVSSRPVVARGGGRAASAGAAILAARAVGLAFEADRLNPVEIREQPNEDDVVVYAGLRMRHDMLARAIMGAIGGPS